MNKSSRGVSLLALVALVALVLIGVGVAVPLAHRHQDAERRAQTRVALEKAFRGLFPHPPGTPGADLHRDFGFRPQTPTVLQRPGDATPSWTLACLMTPAAVGALDPARNPPPAFAGVPGTPAWNGPYWQGSVDGDGRPVDAWGRFLQLRRVTSPSTGWILHSPGSNGLDDTAADSGTPGGDDLVYPQPPYVVPLASQPTFSVTLNLSFVLLAAGACSPGNNVNLTVILTYEDATQTQILVLADGVQMHRKGNGGKPNRLDLLDQTLTLRQDAGAGSGNLQISVAGGCPDGIINPVDFLPLAESGLTYLGSSTTGGTTTYFFIVAPPTPPATTAVPWPITIRP